MPAVTPLRLRCGLALMVVSVVLTVIVGFVGIPTAHAQNIDMTGDVDCSGTVNVLDALVIAQAVVGTRSAAIGCAHDAAVEFNAQVADFDDSGAIDVLDALKIARCAIGAEPCSVDTHVTMMTLNLGHACINANNACLHDDPRPAVTRVAELIVEFEIDVIALQEVDRGSPNHQGIDSIAWLHSELDRLGRPAQSWFENMRTVNGAPYGQAIFTTLPVVSYEVTEVLSPDGPHPDWTWWLQELVVEQAGHEVRAYNTHLPSTAGLNWACTMMETDVLPEARSHSNQMTAMLGDFNFRDNYSCYPEVMSTHVDACALDGDYGCSHSVDPEVHGGGPNGGVTTYDVSVDFIFHDITPVPGATMVDAWGVPDLNDAFVVTDHLPVIALYDLPVS